MEKKQKQTRMNFIPMTTDNFRIAFCQATKPLPEGLQRAIWNLSLDIPELPKAPKKVELSPKMRQLMRNWNSRS
jgi:hypothetical protein